MSDVTEIFLPEGAEWFTTNWKPVEDEAKRDARFWKHETQYWRTVAMQDDGIRVHVYSERKWVPVLTSQTGPEAAIRSAKTFLETH